MARGRSNLDRWVIQRLLATFLLCFQNEDPHRSWGPLIPNARVTLMYTRLGGADSQDSPTFCRLETSAQTDLATWPRSQSTLVGSQDSNPGSRKKVVDQGRKNRGFSVSVCAADCMFTGKARLLIPWLASFSWTSGVLCYLAVLPFSPTFRMTGFASHFEVAPAKTVLVGVPTFQGQTKM